MELTPGQADSENLPDGGTLQRRERPGHRRARRGVQRLRPDARAGTSRSGCTTRASPRTGEFASDLNDSLGNAAPFFEDGADLLRPLDEQEVALRRVVRDTGRVFHAISRENGQLRGADHERARPPSRALASRDDALAETFQILPTFLRETRTTVGRLEQLRAQHRPARARPARARRRPGADGARPGRPVARPREAVPRRRPARGRLGDGRARRHALPARRRAGAGLDPRVPAPSSTRSSSYLSFSRNQVSAVPLGGRASTLARDGRQGGYQGNGAGEHYLTQLAIIDSARCSSAPPRPPWDRGNAYVAPNAYPRAIPLGVIESFDCTPAAASSATRPARAAPRAALLRGAASSCSRTSSTRACGPGTRRSSTRRTGTQGNSPARP